MNNDLISREALKETIDGITWYHINSHGELTEGAFDDDDAFYKAEDIYNAIDNAPTVAESCKELQEVAKESEIIKAYTKGFDTGVETVKNERPQSSLEKPLYKGVLFVDDFGINKVIEVDENGTVTAERIIPRDTFIEAYNKFIKGEEQKGGAE